MCLYDTQVETVLKQHGSLDFPWLDIDAVGASDAADCWRQLEAGTVSIARFSLEDIIMGMNMIQNGHSYKVIGQSRPRHRYKDNFESEIGVVVTPEITRRNDILGRNFCNGFSSDGAFGQNPLVANFFTLTTMAQNCDKEYTTLENELRTISKSFSESCLGGTWSSDENYDHDLRSKYPNLCSACPDDEVCLKGASPEIPPPPLACLTMGTGDVIWTNLQDLRPYLSHSTTNPIESFQNFSYLCPNGELVSVMSQEECSWIQIPWPTFVVKQPATTMLFNLLMSFTRDKLGLTREQKYSSSLIFFGDEVHSFYSFQQASSLENYVHAIAKYYQYGLKIQNCSAQGPIQFCTTSWKEREKCRWLVAAANAYGVTPAIECVQGNDISHCFKLISDHEADVISVHPDFWAAAVRSNDLKPLLFERSLGAEDQYTVMAIGSGEASYTSWEDLRGKKACFPSHDGVAWNTVVDILKRIHPNPENISAEEIVGDFFKVSCVPGAKDYIRNDRVLIDSLCGLCEGDRSEEKRRKRPGWCKGDERDEHFYGDIGAYFCLSESNADVAFMDWNLLMRIFESGFNLKPNISPLCLGVEGEESYAEYYGNTSNCFLSSTPVRQVMVRSDITDVEELELTNTLFKLQTIFGSSSDEKKPKSMRMFGPYEGGKNLLFQDTTKTFSYLNPEDLEDKRQYAWIMMREELESMGEQDEAASASISHVTYVVWVIMLIIHLALYKTL